MITFGYCDKIDKFPNGEQTYCRKHVLDKTPKVILLHFADFFLKNNTLGQNVENLKIPILS